ncbi:MAG: nucleotide sugar dehydrogenase [Sediminibacterium sp.]|nr:nucleotide sugar dehydrogenase [Sediminibacterium sp.]
MNKHHSIGIIGLGYVGLPLGMAFAAKYAVWGYDINPQRVAQLQEGKDTNNEYTTEAISAISAASVQSAVTKNGIDESKGTDVTSAQLNFSNNINDLADCTVYIITVPTPVDAEFEPDLSYIINASQLVAGLLKKGDLVIYESTVYPGCTEEVCVPVLVANSGKQFNQDFFVGYSPERINPGDHTRPITSIVKITSGSTPAAAQEVDELYASIITAGTYLAPSIKVAEAAKAIENAQRDVNISFMNELALIFDRLEIDTQEVLKAAATKWNFLPFKPGLVGGHCIGVDPHYLAFKAKQVGYTPEVILSGRRVNQYMGQFVGEKIIALLAKKYQGNISGKTVLILGFAFKENCADTRNTKVIDIYTILIAAGLNVEVYDPLVNADTVQREYGLSLIQCIPSKISNTNSSSVPFITDQHHHAEPDQQFTQAYDAIVLAVAHEAFKAIDFAAMKVKVPNGTIIYDTKGVLPKELINGRL